MKTLYHALPIIVLAIFLFLPATLDAQIKDGSATVKQGSTITVEIGAAYARTLKKATGISYYWRAGSSDITIMSRTNTSCTIKGNTVGKTVLYYECSYYYDGYYRTMDFYYDITVTSNTISVSRVEMTPSSATLEIGATLQLTATAYPTIATNRNLKWTTENYSVASVSNDGLVTARGAGKVWIWATATDGSNAGNYCVITVVEATKVKSVTLSEREHTMNVGDMFTLVATVNPSNAGNKSVAWSSDNTNVATVSSSGIVTGKSPGIATITCKAQDGSGVTATCVVTIKDIVHPESITLSQSSVSVTIGETLHLSATVSPYDAFDKTVTWMSDNNGIASVDANGVVTAKAVGTANIIATTTNNLAAICIVNVDEPFVGECTNWEGSYVVSSHHVENNPTRLYIDNFNMVIEAKDGAYYVTAMFDEDLTIYNNGGLKIRDNGDGTATIDISYYNILRYTSDNEPLYAIYVFDETADDWADTWALSMNDDGSITLEDFYVAAFTWHEDDEIWRDGQLEALYYRLKAYKMGSNGISDVVAEEPNIHIGNGMFKLDEPTNITVYKDNGVLVFSGKTDCVENLPHGLYIVKVGHHSKKIFVK